MSGKPARAVRKPTATPAVAELEARVTALEAELREARAQQEAVAEILGAINSSPGDLAPVFEAILEKAHQLCGATLGALGLYDGENWRAVAVHGYPEDMTEQLRQGSRGSDNPFLRPLLDGASLAHIADPARIDHPIAQRAAAAGIRTALFVPMRKGAEILGTISAARHEQRPFSDRDIALLQNFAAQAAIAIENARLLGETREALQQQTATAEVLQVINASPGDLQPVFEAMLEKACRLCDASLGALQTWDGENFRVVAHRNTPQFEVTDYGGGGLLRPEAGTTMERIVRGEDLVHIADLAADEAYRTSPFRRALVDIGGARTLLSIALRKEDALVGALHIYRNETRPFSETQVALLQNFAAQAVIAMENARLINETREALERQTATAEILRVISGSPTDLQPTFDAIAAAATTLCGAANGSVFRFDGSLIHLVAHYGLTAAQLDTARGVFPVPPGRGSLTARAIMTRQVVNVADSAADPEFAHVGLFRSGLHGTLSVPMLRDGNPIGAITVTRREIEPFTEKQIGLLETFADQAVIAIENVRLFNETREALEQQTATAEVLGVINSSPSDLAPVFDAILEKAHNLCGADHGSLQLYDGDTFRAVAVRGRMASVAAQLRQPRRPDPGQPTYRLLEGEPFVHVRDLVETDGGVRNLGRLAGLRTVLYVALRKEGALLGFIGVGRREVRPFSEKEIALLQNFAAQAVIAMENARLMRETREALEQQTATAEVLQVINASPGDLAPVFDAMLNKALDLCDAPLGMLYRFDGEAIHALAVRGASGPLAEVFYEPVPIEPESMVGRLSRGEGEVVQVPDIVDTDTYRAGVPSRVKLVELTDARTAVWVPLRKDAALIGVFVIYRREVRPFTDKQIALLQNFAAQAVIAMENARLLGELRERTRDLEESLEYQTATSDVLKVISRSTFDLQRVLETLAQSAAALARSDTVFIFRREGEVARLVAQHAPTPAFGAAIGSLTLGPDRKSTTGRALLTGEVVRILDVQQESDYRLPESEIDRIGSTMAAPLLRDGETIGVMTLARLRVEPYTDRQVELIRTFADQAVIAMENARLLGELRERTRDLEESLEYQTATSDVLKVISRSTFDLQPMLDTLIDSAARLCAAEVGMMANREGGVLATFAFAPEFDAIVRDIVFEPGRGSVTGRALFERRTVHVPDIAADPEYALPEVITVGRMRTALAVPLLRGSEPIGAIYLARQRVEPFSERQIELVRTFADQAVIAIENTRLITETREALKQQTATAEVLQVINASPGDLAPVFDAMLDKAMRLCEAQTAHLLRYEDGSFLRAASLGVPRDFDTILPLNTPVPHIVTRDSVPYRVLASRAAVHLPDLREDESYRRGAPAEARAVETGIRTALFVPLLREDEVVGCFVMHRMAVRPFTDKQIALLQSFAAQAVIAIDNARLLDEIRRRQAELRVTFDNMGDGVAMFDAELRLAAWNRNFEELLELPEAFLAGRPSFADYLRFLAERGEYGTGDIEAELSRRLERAGEELRFERTRPDGRVIELRRNAVPGGGFVLMYGDVTERKRAEAEIRAARDAAEKALGELKTAQASLVHAEKMASLGQLTAGIAHEIKNPLNFVNNFAGLSVELLDELRATAAPGFAALDPDRRAEIDETIDMLTGNLGKIAEHGRRADGIVKSMLAHSRGTSGERQAVDLNALVEEALNLAYHGARAQDQNFNIAMEREFDRALPPVELVPQDVTRVFLNLIGNGFHAARKRQKAAKDAGFRPVIKIATRDLGDAVEVTVRDNGTGISPEHREKLFQPFFTTKPTGEGTGLGLSISWDIVTQQHGGTITVDSEVGDFTEFTVRLPRRAQGTTSGGIA